MKSSRRGGDAFFLTGTKAPNALVKKLRVSVESGGGGGGAKPYHSELKTKQEERKMVHSRVQAQYS